MPKSLGVSYIFFHKIPQEEGPANVILSNILMESASCVSVATNTVTLRDRVGVGRVQFERGPLLQLLKGDERSARDCALLKLALTPPADFLFLPLFMDSSPLLFCVGSTLHQSWFTISLACFFRFIILLVISFAKFHPHWFRFWLIVYKMLGAV